MTAPCACGPQNRERLHLDLLLEQHKARRNAEEAGKLGGTNTAGSSPQLPPFGAAPLLLPDSGTVMLELSRPRLEGLMS